MSDNTADLALNQCQHMAYDALVKIEEPMEQPMGTLSKGELRRAAHTGLVALRAVNRVAETGVADPQFVRRVQAEDEAGDMSTGDGLGGDPRRDEDNQAALDAAPFPDHLTGHPKECRGFPEGGGKPRQLDLERCEVCREIDEHGEQVQDEVAYSDRERLAGVLAERVDWLCREGWDVQAGDYRRGEVTLTELLRRLNDEPAVVEQIATWLEEDAAEEAPQTTLTPPLGCTGAVMYDPQGRPSIQHDAGTCPIHEGDELAAAKAQAQDNYGDEVSDVAVCIFAREFVQHGATNVELGRAVRKLLL